MGTRNYVNSPYLDHDQSVTLFIGQSNYWLQENETYRQSIISFISNSPENKNSKQAAYNDTFGMLC